MTDKRVDNQEGPDELGRDDTPNVKPPSRPESVEEARSESEDHDPLPAADDY
jgi:hypothetical protein